MDMKSVLVCLVSLLAAANAFVPSPTSASQHRRAMQLHAEEVKAAPLISGEELEVMLQDLEIPLIVDAYATWCGPCLLMAPEFEEAAKELKGKVNFVKLDTDKDETMAARLNIMGLPTLLFLEKYEPKEGDENKEASAVLKGRIEGALQKQNIIDLADHYFFDGPAPQLF